jgi:hypothetical protein
VPFDFMKRKKEPDAAPATPEPVAPVVQEGVPFDGLTEDWRLTGRMLIEGRLSDALNKREPIAIVGVQWAPIDGSGPLVDAPGLKTVDPYDLVIVLAGDESLPDMNDEERSAHRVHKVSYEVALEVPPYRDVWTVFLYPGSEPEGLLNRASEMFVPVVEATATIGDLVVGDGPTPAILVNRAYLRGVEQVDARTGERHQTLPGASMGGTNWTDRTR